MDIEVTQTAADNPTPPAPANAAAAGDAGEAAGFPGGDALRDYGQRLSEALRAKGQELALPAKRRALWPVAVGALAALVAARDVLFSSAGPSRASAAFALTSAAGNRGGSESMSSAAQTPASRSSLRAWLDEPVAPVERNIFTLDQFPADPGAEFGAAEAKSVAGLVDPNQRREGPVPAPIPIVSDRDAASVATGRPNEQARQIRLQSTLMGAAQPAALVNGQLVREGDVVATGSGVSRTAYRVLKIEARLVILEREGIRSEIPLE
jgi:hypothetical protein